jgi:amphi-Trp domain-containing protein
MAKPDRDVTRSHSKKEFVAKLRRLADALEAGKPFTIQVHGERITVPASAAVSIEHEREEGIDELEFQLTWERRGAGQDAEEEEEDEQEDEDSEESED